MPKNYCRSLPQHRQQQLIEMARHRVIKALEAYSQSPAHTLAVLQGKWHLAQQIHKVKQRAILQFSRELSHKGFTPPFSRAEATVIAAQTRAWLRRQESVWGLTTRTLTHIGPSDVPAGKK